MVDIAAYENFLSKAPDHHDPRFLDFLRENNVVVFENKMWLVIENMKYHKPEAKYHTAFLKSNEGYFRLMAVHFSSLESVIIEMGYTQWEMKIKRPLDRSIRRFHVHFIENGTGTIENG